MADGLRLELDERFVYIDPVEGRIEVPKGFVTDLASTPRFVWAFLPPHGKYKWGAVIHDFVYKTQRFGKGFKGWRRADNMLYRAMCNAPVRPWLLTRAAIWLGLVIGGWRAYWISYQQKELVNNYWRT